jgi:hypothetical protein
VEGGRKHSREAEVVDLVRKHLQTKRKEINKERKNQKGRGKVASKSRR